MHLPHGHDLGYVAGLGAAVLALVLVGSGWLRSRRSLRRRLTALALRLADDPRSVSSRLEGLLALVERAVDSSLERSHDSAAGSARLAGALDAVPWAVVVCDEDGRPSYRNRAADALVSGRRGDAIVLQALEEQLARPGGEERTVELLGPPARTVSLRSAPIDDGRRVVGTVVVAEDVTARRRADRLQEDFIANAGHELRAPVGALAVLAEMLAEEGSREVVRRLAGRLRREAERANRVVDDLITLGRLGAVGGERPEPVPIGAVVAEAVDRVGSLAEARGVPVEMVEGPDDAAVRGDPRQLGSAVFNLVENAVKYSPPGHPVRVTARQDDDHVEVVVSDEGVGIPAEELERVFERFYRGGSRVAGPGSEDPGGTGLGLPIARRVADDHGGEVLVESVEGCGSTFVLRLPRSQKQRGERCPIASTA
ncbi:MAG TPA: HAMP domain-containing sensor histidine kinase [Acidimicrobiales bacterium]|nr:HAMP domain-containing sensor histidine kinase [Acidimicrobiales bacterium]